MKPYLPLLVWWPLLAACADAAPTRGGPDGSAADAGADARETAEDGRDAGEVAEGGPVTPAKDAGPDAAAAEAGPDVAPEDAGPDAAPDAGDGTPMVAVQKCETTAPTSCDDPPTTYADIDPVLEEYCRSCHDGEFGGPWPLNSYEHTAAWQTDIRSAMLDCSMPPRDAGIAMPTEDRQRLLEWVRCGAPK